MEQSYYEKHKKEKLQYQRKYNIENKDKIDEYQRQYYVKKYIKKRGPPKDKEYWKEYKRLYTYNYYYAHKNGTFIRKNKERKIKTDNTILSNSHIIEFD